MNASDIAPMVPSGSKVMSEEGDPSRDTQASESSPTIQLMRGLFQQIWSGLDTTQV